MSNKHTSGPWTSTLIRVQTSICDESGRVIAYTHGINVEPSEDAANARLIAAAPELLDALRKLLADAENVRRVMLHEAGIGMVDESALDAARAAIAKAIGT